MTSEAAAPAAVVTGSSRGLGRAFALDLARVGAQLVVNGTDEAAVRSVVDEIVAGGGTAVGVTGSVTDHRLCQPLVDTCVGQFGSIDVLVNNAGITRDRSLMKMTEAEFDDVIATHLRGTWSCSTAAARAMTAGSSIINITSGSGLFGMYGQGNYSAAKAGIVGLSRVMDLELGRRGIRVNVVSPVAATGMTSLFAHGNGVEHEHDFPPPDRVAPIVTFLAGSGSRHLHGQVLSFDGTRLSVWSHPEATDSFEHDRRWAESDFASALTVGVQQPYHPDRWGSGVVEPR